MHDYHWEYIKTIKLSELEDKKLEKVQQLFNVDTKKYDQVVVEIGSEENYCGEYVTTIYINGRRLLTEEEKRKLEEREKKRKEDIILNDIKVLEAIQERLNKARVLKSKGEFK